MNSTAQGILLDVVNKVSGGVIHPGIWSLEYVVGVAVLAWQVCSDKRLDIASKASKELGFCAPWNVIVSSRPVDLGRAKPKDFSEMLLVTKQKVLQIRASGPSGVYQGKLSRPRPKSGSYRNWGGSDISMKWPVMRKHR